LCIEPGEVSFQRALPDAKDVLPLTPNDPADKLPAVPETTHNLFDWRPILCQREDRGVDLFPPQIGRRLTPRSFELPPARRSSRKSEKYVRLLMGRDTRSTGVWRVLTAGLMIHTMCRCGGKRFTENVPEIWPWDKRNPRRVASGGARPGDCFERKG
jgi:hypothetical protein